MVISVLQGAGVMTTAPTFSVSGLAGGTLRGGSGGGGSILLGGGLVLEVKNNSNTLSGICPEIDEILKDTFGCVIYQEQVIQIVHKVFKKSMGQADMVRRAIGKKDPELMAKMIAELKAVDTGLPESQVEHILKTIEECSGYLFNKSHSAAYAYTSYQTAYLKAKYPKEFYCALLNSNINTDKVREYIGEVKNAGIEILPPHCNYSEKRWVIEGNALRYGLEKIKNVGNCDINKCDINTIINPDEGDWLKEFCKQNPNLNKQVIISMAKAGCFNCSVQWAIEYIEWFKADYPRRQDIHERLIKFRDNPKKIAEWKNKLSEMKPSPRYFETSLEEEIEYQKEVLGFPFLSKLGLFDISLCDRNRDVEAGEVIMVKKSQTKKGDAMLMLDIVNSTNKTLGFILFRDAATMKVAIGDVVMIRRDRSPWHKNGDRIKGVEIIKAKRK